MSTNRNKNKNITKSPSNNRKGVLVNRTIQTSQSFIGPIPPSNEFAKYEEILPGAADRLLTMAEKEQSNRHEFQNNLSKNSFYLQKRGQTFGFCIAVIGLIGGAYLLSTGSVIAGSVFGAIGLSPLVKTFVSSDNKKKEESNPTN